MNASRSVMWILGVAFLLAGAYLLYFQTNLSQWVSIGVLSAGVLLFIGLAVMAFASSAPNDQPGTVINETRRDDRAPASTTITNVQRERPRDR